MLKTPLVSAIMPTYNMAYYIGEAIKGIIEQTYDNWELIIVDDGSTDNTQEIVEKFKDPRIRYIKQSRKGRGGARNTALRKAEGTYIAIVDADDISLPKRFELQVNFLESHPDIAVVGGQILHLVEKEKPILLSKYPTSPNEIRERFQKGVMGVPHPAAMIRQEVFERVGGYCEECLRAQDLELFLRISHFYKMANLNETVLLYRNDPRRTTFSFWVRLHLFHEYALHRYKCLAAGRQPQRFEQWSKRRRVWCKLLTWHTFRFFKTKFVVSWRIWRVRDAFRNK